MSRRPEKLLLVVTKGNFGGAQRYVFELACGLRDQGMQVAVASGAPGALVDRLTEAGIRHFPVASFQRDISLTREFRALGELRAILRDFAPDVVHLNSSKAGGLGAVAARLQGIPRIVFTTHGWPFQEVGSPLRNALARFGSWGTALLCHRVITVSENDLALGAMPFVGNRMRRVHTAVPPFPLLDPDTAMARLFDGTDWQPPEGTLRFVSLAELTANKNLGMAIQAVARHNREHPDKIAYAIFGEGELHDDLQSQIDQLGMREYIHLCGYRPAVRRCLRAFEVFLLPSIKEGLPYAILEAGHAGLPVIASRVGGIPEVIRDGETGLLIDPRDAETLARALDACTDPALRETLAEALRTRVARDFTLAQMISQTRKVYEAQ